MFAKTYRLRAKKDFDALWKRGKSVHGQALGIKYSLNNLGGPRIGVVVSTKIHKRSVQRNLIRRRIREALRREYVPKIKNFDIVVIAKNNIVGQKYAKISEDLGFVFKKAGLI
ncbi:MAG TPA: ribonuclease P protein component [Candidatus Omnitrophica bacterium]|nr:ribonuclease P protein component [Candidatus Omnitrophota bacterium]